MTTSDRITLTATAACGAYFFARALPLLVADFCSWACRMGRIGW